jgi:hypothetical protein
MRLCRIVKTQTIADDLTILLVYKIDLKTNSITRDEKESLMVVKLSIHLGKKYNVTN